MRRFLTHPFLTISLALVAVLVPTSASAAEIRQGNSVAVAPGETIDDDLYVFGGNLDVQGTVNGDVVFVGGRSTVSGLITGDVLVLGGSTIISGEVRGSVRAAGGTVNMVGRVDQDLAVAAGTLDVAPSATIGRDLLAGVGSTSIAGPITRNAFIGSGDITFAAPVGGDVRAQAGTVRLGNNASIGGRFWYASQRQAEIASGVVVGGGIERGQSAYGRDVGASLDGVGGLAGIGALLWLRGLVGMLLLGLVLMVMVPSVVRRSTSTLSSNLGAGLGFGLLLLVGIPLLATLVFAVGLLIGGWWLGIAMLFLYALALGAGYVVSATLLGELIVTRVFKGRAPAALSLVLGVLILGSVALVPVAGGIATGAAVTAGIGALGLVAIRHYRGQRQPVASPVMVGPSVAVPTPA
ncbi:MAG TPA: polymer-forming cytoskeletal protein [Chloroflexota bacterium]